MAALLTVVLAVAVTAWFFFLLGLKSSVRRRSLNHHQMAMLLVDLRTKDDVMPMLSEQTRLRLNELVDGYERLDLDDDQGSSELGIVAGLIVMMASVAVVLLTVLSLPR